MWVLWIPLSNLFPVVMGFFFMDVRSADFYDVIENQFVLDETFRRVDCVHL